MGSRLRGNDGYMLEGYDHPFLGGGVPPAGIAGLHAAATLCMMAW